MTTAALELVVPAGIDDPALPSGGNRYDRRLIDELRQQGRTVREHQVAPPDLPAALDLLPDGAVVLVDGLLAVDAPDVVVPTAKRVTLVVLLHMPFAEAFQTLADAERDVLTAAAGVITTSEWSRRWVVRHHGVDAARVWTAQPGVDPAPSGRRPRSRAPSGELLCVAAVTRAKGHDVLLSALAEIADLEWRCTCVGPLQLEPDFVADLRSLAARTGIAGRLRFAGPLHGDDLDAAVAGADLLVSASRHEAYGMGVTEAIARGVPVVVTDVGGHHEAVAGGGVLVPPDDPDRLADALRRWLESGTERTRLRAVADVRRAELRPWSTTAARVADALDVLNPDGPGSVFHGDRTSADGPATPGTTAERGTAP